MASYVSLEGVWYPAKEHAVLEHLSGTKNEIYDGPDRSAELELAKAYGVDETGKPKVITFGMNFRENPDFIDFVRQRGFKDAEEYLKFIGYDAKAAKEVFDRQAAVIIKHKLPERKPEPIVEGGGISTAPGNETIVGGFGEEKVRPISEIKR